MRRCAGTSSCRPPSAPIAHRGLDCDDVLRTLEVPLPVTQGRADSVMLPTMAEHVLATCPTAEPSSYEGVGRVPHLEEPERLNRELADLTRRVQTATDLPTNFGARRSFVRTCVVKPVPDADPRDAAATLVISVKTAGVHVSHLLRKLAAANRREAAAIAHRRSPPPVGQPSFGRETPSTKTSAEWLSPAPSRPWSC
jgi:hypothetical protein